MSTVPRKKSIQEGRTLSSWWRSLPSSDRKLIRFMAVAPAVVTLLITLIVNFPDMSNISEKPLSTTFKSTARVVMSIPLLPTLPETPLVSSPVQQENKNVNSVTATSELPHEFPKTWSREQRFVATYALAQHGVSKVCSVERNTFKQMFGEAPAGCGFFGHVLYEVRFEDAKGLIGQQVVCLKSHRTIDFSPSEITSSSFF